MDNSAAVKSDVLSFLNKYMDVTSVGEDEDIFQKGFVNSLFSMQLLMFLEGRFDFTIEPDDILPENMSSVNNILAFIERKLGRIVQNEADPANYV